MLFLLERSRPGVFAAGDVLFWILVKRVEAAVCEGFHGVAVRRRGP